MANNPFCWNVSCSSFQCGDEHCVESKEASDQDRDWRFARTFSLLKWCSKNAPRDSWQRMNAGCLEQCSTLPHENMEHHQQLVGSLPFGLVYATSTNQQTCRRGSPPLDKDKVCGTPSHNSSLICHAKSSPRHVLRNVASFHHLLIQLHGWPQSLLLHHCLIDIECYRKGDKRGDKIENKHVYYKIGKNVCDKLGN